MKIYRWLLVFMAAALACLLVFIFFAEEIVKPHNDRTYALADGITVLVPSGWTTPFDKPNSHSTRISMKYSGFGFNNGFARIGSNHVVSTVSVIVYSSSEMRQLFPHGFMPTKPSSQQNPRNIEHETLTVNGMNIFLERYIYNRDDYWHQGRLVADERFQWEAYIYGPHWGVQIEARCMLQDREKFEPVFVKIMNSIQTPTQ